MIQVGELSLWVALLMAVWAATVSFAGGALGRRDLRASGERAIYATLVLVMLACIGLWTALCTHDFSINYVASFSSANLPKVYTLAAFWSGQAGSILFFCLILSAYSSVALFTARPERSELTPWMSGTLAVVMTVLLATLCFAANPFKRLDWVPPDGLGMRPELQSPGMTIHPPTLYLGYAATGVAFAFAIAALKSRRFDAVWLASIRRWTLVSWFFITVGIVFGMWWAYVEAGSGGEWVWQPVRNGSLLPWLVNTALLHSIRVQEKRGMLRKWNIALVVLAFVLSILLIFIVRLAPLAGVSPVAQLPVGIYIAAFGVSIGVGAYLVASRRDDIRPGSRLVARDRRRYVGYIAHVGLAVMFAGIAGVAFSRHSDLVLASGEAKKLVDPYGNTWRVTSQGMSRYDVLNREVTALALTLTRDGRRAGLLTTEKRQYVDSRGAPTFDPSTEAGVRGSWRQDVYVSLTALRDDGSAQLRVTFNPLVRWVWAGGALMALGGLILMWPQSGGSRWHVGYSLAVLDAEKENG